MIISDWLLLSVLIGFIIEYLLFKNSKNGIKSFLISGMLVLAGADKYSILLDASISILLNVLFAEYLYD